jgi:hypothetical protein
MKADKDTWFWFSAPQGIQFTLWARPSDRTHYKILHRGFVGSDGLKFDKPTLEGWLGRRAEYIALDILWGRPGLIHNGRKGRR